MFGFKKKQDKEHKFITKDEANQISQDFINSGNYDKGTMRLIQDIEKEIIRNAIKGFNNLNYSDFHICYAFNEKLLVQHFKNKGYGISEFHARLTSYGEIYLRITIHWN